jgi:hypothetical protein
MGPWGGQGSVFYLGIELRSGSNSEVLTPFSWEKFRGSERGEASLASE